MYYFSCFLMCLMMFHHTCGGGVKSNDKRLSGENVCFIVGPSIRFRILIKLFDPQHVAPGWEGGERGKRQHEGRHVKLNVATNASRPLPVNVNILLLVGLLPQPFTLQIRVCVCSVESVGSNIKMCLLAVRRFLKSRIVCTCSDPSPKLELLPL